MRAICKMITGEEITINGAIVDNIANYFSGKGDGFNRTAPLGWVSTIGDEKPIAINFAHVVYINFEDVTRE